jgi:hypothetical protein
MLRLSCLLDGLLSSLLTSLWKPGLDTKASRLLVLEKDEQTKNGEDRRAVWDVRSRCLERKGHNVGFMGSVKEQSTGR